MERINNERIIVSLFAYGFDTVDSNLYNFVLSKLSMDNGELCEFRFANEPFSGFFSEIVVFDEKGYHLKDDLTLNSKINEKYNATIRDALNINKELINYFDTLDFKEAVFKKILQFGVNQIDQLEESFCAKEREIIADMFGIDDSISIFREAYQNMTGNELPDIDIVHVGQEEKTLEKSDDNLVRKLYIPYKDI